MAHLSQILFSYPWFHHMYPQKLPAPGAEVRTQASTPKKEMPSYSWCSSLPQQALQCGPVQEGCWLPLHTPWWCSRLGWGPMAVHRPLCDLQCFGWRLGRWMNECECSCPCEVFDRLDREQFQKTHLNTLQVKCFVCSTFKPSPHWWDLGWKQQRHEGCPYPLFLQVQTKVCGTLHHLKETKPVPVSCRGALTSLHCLGGITLLISATYVNLPSSSGSTCVFIRFRQHVHIHTIQVARVHSYDWQNITYPAFQASWISTYFFWPPTVCSRPRR